MKILGCLLFLLSPVGWAASDVNITAEGGSVTSDKLQPYKEGLVRYSFGILYGASMNRRIQAPQVIQQQIFQQVYSASGFVPDFSLFYEYQFFRSPGLGHFGVLVLGGLTFFQGKGRYQSSLIPVNTNPVAVSFMDSMMKFKFFLVPVTMALQYRLDLLKYIQPFIRIGPMAMGYFESRSDGLSGHYGYSAGVYQAAGLLFLFDWIYPSGAWDLYAQFGIHHSYFSVEWSRWKSWYGLVDFHFSGIVAGLTFEY